jgi:hypothetical protein
LASGAEYHVAHPIAQAFDFLGIGSGAEALGEVEKLLLLALLGPYAVFGN